LCVLVSMDNPVDYVVHVQIECSAMHVYVFDFIICVSLHNGSTHLSSNNDFCFIV
jgi:hypothetical protein